MGIGMIICNYAYSAFMLIKTACEVFMQIAELTLDGIFTIVKTTIKFIQFTLAKALEAIILGVQYAIEALMSMLSFFDLKNSFLCSNMYKCNFIKEQILNPNSLVSKAIYAIWDYVDGDDDEVKPNSVTGEADTTRNNVKATQAMLYQIVNDWDTFRNQLCGGLTIDVQIGAVRSLLQGFQATLNAWADLFQKKVDYIYRLMQGYLDTMRNSEFFSLLDQIKQFFDCLIDSYWCSNVDTSKSFFNHCMKVCGLVDNGNGEYGLSTAMVKEATSPVEGFVATCNQTKRVINKALKFLANPGSMKGANNAFKLNSTIKGVYQAMKTGKLSKIPIVKYIRQTSHDIFRIWRHHHPEPTSYDSVFINTKMSADRIRIKDDDYPYNFGTETNEFVEVDADADLSTSDDIILVNGKVYTVAETAIAMNFRDKYPKRYETMKTEYEDVLNYCDDMNRFMTDLVNLKDTVQCYK